MVKWLLCGAAMISGIVIALSRKIVHSNLEILR